MDPLLLPPVSGSIPWVLQAVWCNKGGYDVMEKPSVAICREHKGGGVYR